MLKNKCNLKYYTEHDVHTSLGSKSNVSGRQLGLVSDELVSGKSSTCVY